MTSQILQKYQSGSNVRRIAAELGVSMHSVRRALDGHTRDPGRPKAKEPSTIARAVIADLANGMSRNQAAAANGITRQAVAWIVKRWGCKSNQELATCTGSETESEWA